jgi:hypothetical protein
MPLLSRKSSAMLCREDPCGLLGLLFRRRVGPLLCTRGPKVYTRGYYPRSRVAVRSSTPRVAVHSGMHGLESAGYMLSHLRPPISRRRMAGLARPRRAPPLAPTPGPAYPGCQHSLPRALFACHVFVREPFSLQTPVGRSERVGLLGHKQIRFP